ncbi:MAG: phage portal protein [Planctomycetes bacterium]|nr:phage portal protein [Planctomycetota bacterium]
MFGPTFSTLTCAGLTDLAFASPQSDADVYRAMTMGLGAVRHPRPSQTYSRVAVVYACVREKAKAIGGLPLMISTGEDKIVESGPASALTEQPNPNMTARAFWSHTSAYLDLFGRVHWWLELDSIGRPLSVIPINPLQMKPIVDRSTGKLTGWRYSAAGALRGRQMTIPVDEVWTIIDPDYESPDCPFEGLSPRKAAMSAIAQYWKADIANESSLDNGVTPSGAFVFPPTMTVTKDDRRDITDELRQFNQGVENRRNYLVLGGGMDWKQLGADFADMEFSELKAMSRVDICAVFNVPPPVCGFYEDSNYAHSDSAEQNFWVRTILPRGVWLAEEWTIGVLRRFEGDRSLAAANASTRRLAIDERVTFGYRSASKAASRSRRKLYAWFDSSGIPAVQKAMLAMTQSLKTWFEMGVPLNQIIRASGAPFEEVTYGNTWFKPIALVDVAEDSTPGKNDGTGAEPIDDATMDDRSFDDEAVTKADDLLGHIWMRWRASWAGLERLAYSKLKRHNFELRAETLARLNQYVPEIGVKALSDIERRDIVTNIVFDIVPANGKLLAKMRPIIRDSYRLGGEQSMQEAADAQGGAKPGKFNMRDERVVAKMRRREVRVTGTNKTTQRKLAKTLAEGLDAGEGRADLAKRVKEVFKDAAGRRAANIARTEVSAALEESRHEGREQAGVPLKSWLWSRKETGRPAHAATQRQTMAMPIPNGDRFTIVGTGETCDHPKDASLSAGQSVNCGCLAISRFPGDTLKAVLARYATRGFLTYEQLMHHDHQADTTATIKGKDASDEPNQQVH